MTKKDNLNGHEVTGPFSLDLREIRCISWVSMCKLLEWDTILWTRHHFMLLGWWTTCFALRVLPGIASRFQNFAIIRIQRGKLWFSAHSKFSNMRKTIYSNFVNTTVSEDRAPLFCPVHSKMFLLMFLIYSSSMALLIGFIPNLNKTPFVLKPMNYLLTDAIGRLSHACHMPATCFPDAPQLSDS